MTKETIERVQATSATEALIHELRDQYGPVLFHQSSGCCDGSVPMCYPVDDFFINETDVWLGQVAGANFYMSHDQFEYWRHTQITVDVVEGRGASFSLEAPRGVRFLIKSRLFKDEEMQRLSAVRRGES